MCGESLCVNSGMKLEAKKFVLCGMKWLHYERCVYFQQEIMVGSMYQAETPVGLCKYKDNEKGKLAVCLAVNICILKP